MPGKKAGHESVVGELEGLVATDPEAAADRPAFVVDLFRWEGGIERDVGHEPQEAAPVSCERGAPYLGVVHVAGCVEAPAHALGLVRDGQRCPGGGALDEDVLQQIADARSLLALPPAAHANKDDGRYRGRGGVLLDEQGQTAVELAANDLGMRGDNREKERWRGKERRRGKERPRTRRHQDSCPRPPRAHGADPLGMSASLT